MFIQGTRGRVRVSTYGDAMEEDDDFEENDIGLAFSGGGIRSAAFCSGVLRRLLQKDIKVNYVSCISGGNFTAAAYLDWKLRHENEDDPKWHQEFFDHMRKRVGYVCDWQNCFKGIGDTIILLLVMLFVNLLIPLTVWGGMAIPVAYLVDFIYGNIMRAGFDCSNITIPQQQFFKNVTKCGNVYNLNDTETIKQLILFVTLAVIFLFLYVVKVIIKRTTRVCNFLQLVAGIMFGLVFMPWFMQQFTDIIPAWMNVLILGLSIFFWCGFPPLRNFAALAIIFYLYGYIIKWRVYRSGFSFEYQEHYFYTALLAAGVVLWASPYLGVFTRTAIYNFIKWRLQFAFFTRQSVGRCGCNGITCSDLFPVLSTLCSCSACANKSHHQALTMADIVHTNPQYISNIVADYWRRDAKRLPETMIGLCSKKIEIITDEPGLDQLNCKLKPRHIKLADAMSTAAMITKPPAELNEKFEPFRELQLILGLSATHNINTKPDEDFGCKCEWFKIVPFILQSFSGAPLIFLAVVWLADLELDPILIERLVMIVFISYVLIFAAVAMLPTGGKKPWCAETIVRYRNFHYHKQTKDQWARDDPAFLVLLSFWLCVSSVGFAIVLKLHFLGFIKFLLWVVFVDCIGVGLAIATLLWFICNRYLRLPSSHGTQQRVEWAYAFDVHLNAFFPLLIILHVIQLFFIIDHPWFISRFIGNSLWLIALVYYIYITFLGYSALPFLRNTVTLLYPPVITVIIFYIISIAIGWNFSQSVMYFYKYRVL